MKYNQAGTYEIEYKAVDECGNETTETRTIVAEDALTYSTILFNDGFFAINVPSDEKDAYIADHGEITEEYDPLDETHDYVFTGASARPWDNSASKITEVVFASACKPTSLAYWFQSASNMTVFDDDTFDGSEVVNARAAFAGTNIASLALVGMSKLENIRFICNKCKNLKNAHIDGSKVLTEMTDAFQGCYALEQVWIDSEGTINACDRAFANVVGDGKGDMTIATIYANENLDFSRATSSANLFRSCTSLVGGNGTTFDSNYTDKQYARIDKAGTPGYFTEE